MKENKIALLKVGSALSVNLAAFWIGLIVITPNLISLPFLQLLFVLTTNLPFAIVFSRVIFI